MSKESESGDTMLGLIILLIIGGLIYIGKNKSKNEFPINSITESTDSIIKTSDDIKNDNLVLDKAKFDSLIKNSVYVGSTSDTPTDIRRKADFCTEYTKTCNDYSNMKKSYFCVGGNGDVIIQKMYISDIAGGYGKKYRIIVEEANQEGYIDAMASKMVEKYKENGVFDEFDKQGFIEFRLDLISEDGHEIISKFYSIY